LWTGIEIYLGGLGALVPQVLLCMYIYPYMPLQNFIPDLHVVVPSSEKKEGVPYPKCVQCNCAEHYYQIYI
jgi:hypothetical protein